MLFAKPYLVLRAGKFKSACSFIDVVNFFESGKRFSAIHISFLPGFAGASAFQGDPVVGRALQAIEPGHPTRIMILHIAGRIQHLKIGAPSAVPSRRKSIRLPPKYSKAKRCGGSLSRIRQATAAPLAKAR